MDQEDDPMSTDMQPDPAAKTLDSLASGVAALSASFLGIPSERDFHFFNNFDEFKRPLRHVAAKSQSLLEAVGGSSKALFRQSLLFPAAAEGEEFDAEEAYDWLVNVNDEILERIDASLEEHGQALRDGMEGKTEGMEDGGFQMVYGKKKKMAGSSVVAKGSVNNGGAGEGSVKVAGHRKGVAGKAKVSFHVATIKRPQEEFSILVNNANQPFQHVWIQTNEDGSRVVHPLENLPVADFVDWSPADGEPVPPPPMEDTPFKFVEDVKDLKQLATKLRGVQEFAVDLEHNQYRSFQGLTCLMQISTREEDYIVDTLKLKIHVGPHLREVFRDPTKRKVMHGADRDIVWLQRDFGIYVCNMFDTGQASRVMNLERKSLEFLLQHFCGVTANKEYQNADWRIRPLPKEMTRYAREDTHYLLYMYDTMRIKLLSMPKENENADPPLLEVYKRSAGICTNLYEKELLTENSYLHIYGLQDAGFSAQQLSVVAALVEWRDAIARAEDESTGYILPNKTLLEIAKQMPVTTNKLHRILKSKHPYVERSLSSVVSIVRHAVQHADAFEETAQRLKAAHSEKMARDKEANADEGKNLASDSQESEAVASAAVAAVDGGNEMDGGGKILQLPSIKDNKSFETGGRFGRDDRHISEKGNPMVSSLYRETSGSPKISFGKATGATVQVLKKPAGAFGALLGNSVPKRKTDAGKKDNEEVRLEKIRSSVSLEIPSFLGRNELPKLQLQEPSKPQLLQTSAKFIAPPATSPKVEDIIVLDDDSDVEPQKDDTEPTTAPMESNSMGLEDVILLDDDSDMEPESLNASKSMDYKSAGNSSKSDGEEDPTSLSDLSNSFQKCLQSNSQSKKASESKESKEQSGGSSEFKPFNYGAAIRFWENTGEKSKAPPVDGGRRRNSSSSAGRGTSGASQGQKDDGTREFAAPRRSQAFPVSGNRSATFR